MVVAAVVLTTALAHKTTCKSKRWTRAAFAMDEDVVQPSAIQNVFIKQCVSLTGPFRVNNAQMSNTAMQCLMRFFVYLVAPTRKWRSGWVPSTHGADDWRAQSIHIYIISIQYPNIRTANIIAATARKVSTYQPWTLAQLLPPHPGPLAILGHPLPFGSLRIPSLPLPHRRPPNGRPPLGEAVRDVPSPATGCVGCTTQLPGAGRRTKRRWKHVTHVALGGKTTRGKMRGKSGSKLKHWVLFVENLVESGATKGSLVL